jgi:diguanylate cyclase (GGDEF)-like protein
LLLIEVAKRVTTCVREMDTVARFGGDEFVVLLGDLDADIDRSTAQAASVAEKVRLSLAQPYLLAVTLPDQCDTTVLYHCSASIGLVLLLNHEASQAELMQRADAAMYQAKETGRNRVLIYEK